MCVGGTVGVHCLSCFVEGLFHLSGGRTHETESLQTKSILHPIIPHPATWFPRKKTGVMSDSSDSAIIRS